MCCKKWEAATGSMLSTSPAAMLYPSEVRNNDAMIVKDDDGTWNVNGCCGGHCYVITGIKFCPFCGASKVETEAANLA